METEVKLKTLQALYAGVLADAVLRLGRAGILEDVTAQKRNEQLAAGKMQAQTLGITTPEQVFAVLPEISGCANWQTEQKEGGFVATASRCMLCAFAKKLGAQKPCAIYCLNPMEGMVKGFGDVRFNVKSTLWEGEECRVEVNR